MSLPVTNEPPKPPVRHVTGHVAPLVADDADLGPVQRVNERSTLRPRRTADMPRGNADVLLAIQKLGDRLDGRIDALGGRIDALDGRIEALAGRLDARMDALAGRIDTLIDSISDMRADLTQHRHDD